MKYFHTLMLLYCLIMGNINYLTTVLCECCYVCYHWFLTTVGYMLLFFMKQIKPQPFTNYPLCTYILLFLS
ncbi:hypothetical protein KSF78_0000768 [Schistosoma japonicum]|nr:hypothetical protein KSF78_0000768 [Schistosoma japonicum]